MKNILVLGRRTSAHREDSEWSNISTHKPLLTLSKNLCWSSTKET